MKMNQEFQSLSIKRTRQERLLQCQYMQSQAADSIILFYLRQLNLQLKEAGQ